MDDIKRWVRNELWDQVPVNISVIDKAFRIVEANRAFSDNYGQWYDRPCYEVYKGRSDRCEHCAALKTFDDGRVRVREELGVEVTVVGGALQSFRDPGSPYVIVFLPVEIAGEPECLEHAELRWCPLDDLEELPLAPADRQFAVELLLPRVAR